MGVDDWSQRVSISGSGSISSLATRAFMMNLCPSSDSFFFIDSVTILFETRSPVVSIFIEPIVMAVAINGLCLWSNGSEDSDISGGLVATVLEL